MDFKSISNFERIPPGGFDVKPSLNLKCIVLTASLALGYWFLPEKNKLVLFSLCYFPYLFLSYYDVKYQAQRNMGPTYLADFYDFLKVPTSNQIKVWKYWAPKWKVRVRLIDLLILLGFLSLLPWLIAWQTPKQKLQTPKQKEDDRYIGIGFFSVCLAISLYCRFFLVS